MRALGLAVVITSAALAAGGVAYRSSAEPSATTPAAVEARPPDAEQGVCRVREPSPRERVEIQLDRRAKARFVPLNRTGYNYSEPGVFRPEVATGAAPPASPDASAPSEPEPKR